MMGAYYAPHHVYIHFPYCLYKCHYCDFNSHAREVGAVPARRYADALIAEICARAGHEGPSRESSQATVNPDPAVAFFGAPIRSVFFGGGTPSLMPPGEVARVLQQLAAHAPLAKDVEITLEANPGTLTPETLEGFRWAGVNRISIGLQSLADENLARFGRIHTAKQGMQAVRLAQNAGFKRVNADLIFGFPGQTLSQWRSDLERAVDLGTGHLSCYALTAEEGTRFTQELRQGRWQETESGLFADMLEFTHDFLFRTHPPYEISNFAKPGSECRHNLGYWRYHSYLGLGAGACSQFVMPASHETPAQVIRTTNHQAPDHYMRTVEQGECFTREAIPSRTAMGEFMMMGLRLEKGILKLEFERIFGSSIETIFAPVIDRQLQEGGLNRKADRLFPTRRGVFLNNGLVIPYLGDSSLTPKGV